MSRGPKSGSASHVPAHLRCEAYVRDCYGRPTNDRCGCHAHVRLKRRRLCMKHAAMFALTLALESREAVPLPRAPVPRGQVRMLGDEIV